MFFQCLRPFVWLANSVVGLPCITSRCVCLRNLEIDSENFANQIMKMSVRFVGGLRQG